MLRTRAMNVYACFQSAVALAAPGLALIMLLLLVIALVTGCRIFGGSRSSEPSASVFPDEIATKCHNAQADAVQRYYRKYGVQPRVPHVRVYLEDKPMNGMGGWTPSAFAIHIWRDQKPFYGSLVHEFGHSLCHYNGKGGSEGAVP